jgi:hypothetical protein
MSELGLPDAATPNYLMLTGSELFPILRWQITLNLRRTCYKQSDARRCSGPRRCPLPSAWAAPSGAEGGAGGGHPHFSPSLTSLLLAVARACEHVTLVFPFPNFGGPFSQFKIF